MNTPTKIPWPRIAVEGVAIVASILLAFAIDAWWEDRQREATEQVVLQTLLNDLQAKQILLADMTTYCEAILESVERLLLAASSTDHALSEQAIDRLMGDTWWVRSEAVGDSAPLSQLIAGGNLSVIANPNLVQQLAELQAAIERAKYHSRNDSAFHENIMTPFMIANSNMSQVNKTIRHRPGHPEIKVQSRALGVAEGWRHSELLATTEYQNLLVAKMERLSDILEVGHPGVAGRLSIVIAMLEDELDR
jgi:hypothetical protein